ncbi:MAG: hypothetical protein R3F56_20755 [Planctomycetota bacterium]
MHTRKLLVLAAVLSLSPPCLRAQGSVGINLFRGVVTLSGVLCGFTCNSTGQATALVGDTIGIRLLGQDQWPGAVMIGAGPAVPCPGLPVPGIGNTLLVDLNTLLVLATSGSITGAARGNCGETANQVMVTLTLPRLPVGTMVHFQGLVYDNFQPAFTRAIELTIN